MKNQIDNLDFCVCVFMFIFVYVMYHEGLSMQQ
jgi:hypothetical protein